jgi:hypothetical protein
MKALEYMEYFAHIDSEQILKSLEKYSSFFLDMKYRMLIALVCAVF